MESVKPDLLNDLLDCLQVPHTKAYTARRLRSVTFPSLFGLSKLLSEYGVESAGYRLSAPSQLEALTPPFVAQTSVGFVIVKEVGRESVTYMTEGATESMPRDGFAKAFSGLVFQAYPTAASVEPDYALHRRVEWFSKAQPRLLALVVAFLLTTAIVVDGWWRHPWGLLLIAFDTFGLWLSYMLVQKTFGITTKSADRVCGVLQKGGCDHILSSSASKFMGMFGWSEVGFAYFSVSLLALLLFPSSVGALALCNLCCLPYTLWSIWYQRFKAHHWCTLCVGVQLTLWCLFFCYLLGGVTVNAFHIDLPLFMLGASYLGVLLGLNNLAPFIHKPSKRV